MDRGNSSRSPDSSTTATMNVRAEQLSAISRMLSLNKEAAGDERSWIEPWKVLVYDRFGRDIISPLLNVGDLRKLGVTLHLLLDSEREPISDAPAVYLVQPTDASVRRIADDCGKRMYSSFYVNFTPSVPRPLLESLAAETLARDATGQVAKVMDQYVNYASLEDDFFSLLLPSAYVDLHHPASADTAVEAAADAVAASLFSVVASLKVVPLLRYTRGGAAQMVAETLCRRLHDAVRSRSGPFSSEGGAAAGTLQRPLLAILDRSIDAGALLQHAWSYCALCHDLLDVRLNRVAIPEPSPDGGGSRIRPYDLHATDTFWAEHKGSAFQTVASEVSATWRAARTFAPRNASLCLHAVPRELRSLRSRHVAGGPPSERVPRVHGGDQQ